VVLTSKYVCTHVCMYVCIYVCMYVHINMYVHMSICTYGHTYVNPLFSWFCLSASSGAVQGLKRTFVLAGMEQFLIQLSLSFVGPMRPEAVLPDRALCLPFQSRLDCQLNYLNPKLPLNFSLSLSLSLVNKTSHSLSLARSLSRHRCYERGLDGRGFGTKCATGVSASPASVTALARSSSISTTL